MSNQVYGDTAAWVNNHQDSLSISDDDLCANCIMLSYVPGFRSLCKQRDRDTGDWPATFDENGYAISCEWFQNLEGPIEVKDTNDNQEVEC